MLRLSKTTTVGGLVMSRTYGESKYTLGELRGRSHPFVLAHWEVAKDLADHVAELEKRLEEKED